MFLAFGELKVGAGKAGIGPEGSHPDVGPLPPPKQLGSGGFDFVADLGQ